MSTYITYIKDMHEHMNIYAHIWVNNKAKIQLYSQERSVT